MGVYPKGIQVYTPIRKARFDRTRSRPRNRAGVPPLFFLNSRNRRYAGKWPIHIILFQLREADTGRTFGVDQTHPCFGRRERCGFAFGACPIRLPGKFGAWSERELPGSFGGHPFRSSSRGSIRCRNWEWRYFRIVRRAISRECLRYRIVRWTGERPWGSASRRQAIRVAACMSAGSWDTNSKAPG